MQAKKEMQLQAKQKKGAKMKLQANKKKRAKITQQEFQKGRTTMQAKKEKKVQAKKKKSAKMRRKIQRRQPQRNSTTPRVAALSMWNRSQLLLPTSLSVQSVALRNYGPMWSCVESMASSPLSK